MCFLCCLVLRLREYSTAHALSLPPSQWCCLRPWSPRSRARRASGIRKAREMMRQEAASLSSSPRWTPSQREALRGRTPASASRRSTEGAVADRSCSSSPALASAPGKAPGHLPVRALSASRPGFHSHSCWGWFVALIPTMGTTIQG